MADHPILFSVPMIVAIDEGRKTQTRRISKFVEPQGNGLFHIHTAFGGAMNCDADTVRQIGADYAPHAVGDRLWVREAWRVRAGKYDRLPPRSLPRTAHVFYEADPQVEGLDIGRLRPGMFMPRWASRLTLVVTDVRVQRLQEISETDAVAEGATALDRCGLFRNKIGWSMDWGRIGTLSNYAMVPPASDLPAPLTAADISLCDPEMAFANYWNRINGPGAWAANPWVTAYTFDVHRCNIDAMEAKP